ncbi:MAG: DUF3656 domain-containing protein [Clostridia bacterium]|nr:DUF3656 domain-containing protein [Clostridia bacterium]
MTDKNNIEILAPAGSFDALTAGVRCGANAVYFGGKAFNARRNADNFDDESMKRAVSYCHARGVKAHITFNTLVTDSELACAAEELERICACGADALILQDLGVIELAKNCAPDIARHASTQMSVQTPAGVKLLEGLGFSRVVLPREMTKDEIREINESCDIETECFVHGALCMCVSGQCYLSSVLGQRSGNRGLCAQPCRLPFAAPGGTGSDLSLKDMSLVSHIKEMSELGVSSFKIEGRMKRPEYVAAAVTACVKSAAGGDCTQEQNDLRAVFSRSGFTDGYYTANRGRDMFGIRRKEDVTSASAVLSKLQRLYDKEQPLMPVRFMLTVRKDEKISLSAKSGEAFAYIEGSVPQPAKSAPATAEGLKEKLLKCGGTPFYVEECEAEVEDGLFVSASEINALRRAALDDLLSQKGQTEKKKFIPAEYSVKPHKTGDTHIYAYFMYADSVPDDLTGIDTAFLPYDADISLMKKIGSAGVRIGAAIPGGLFSLEKKIYDRLLVLKENGITTAYCRNLDAVAIAKKAGMEIHGGTGLNVFNSMSVNSLEKLGVSETTLSFELTLSQAQRIGGEMKRGIVAYGRLPLMTVRNCPLKNGRTCAECDKKGFLTDRMGVKFPVRCSGACSEILNSRPVWLADRLSEIKNMDFITLYFTTETKKECADIISAYLTGSSCKGEFTRGLYYRGVML